MNGTSIIAGFDGTPEYKPSRRRKAMVGIFVEIWKLSFVETGAGHVSETQYIFLTKSGYLISKPPSSRWHPATKTTRVPASTTRRPFARNIPPEFSDQILAQIFRHEESYTHEEYSSREKNIARFLADPRIFLARILVL